ncbi:glycosyltransferase [Streptomyces sp. HNM0645]|uniref:glycosyltransferase family 2 protein n=1 Tax=Streptomyces sp. HNM0645 TaxID=2782343 RepID=UPI0024B70CBD|nr:glycosyltransferase [Streptomyces sp. HNM0645]MDI9888962.1 glycosyltransferase [Streptomyces sp. HNM0645]
MSSSSNAGIPAVPEDRDGTDAPDVTVVVAVREEGRRGLGRCLESLAGQTIGATRIEVLVADGAPCPTDGGARPSPACVRRLPAGVEPGLPADGAHRLPAAEPPQDAPAAPSSSWPSSSRPWASPYGGGPTPSSGRLRAPSGATRSRAKPLTVERTGTLNQALARARGRYLFFLDAGDLLGREALSRLVDAADGHGADVVCARAAGSGSGSGVFARTRHRVPLDEPGLPWELSTAKLFRREPLLRHGLRFAEDVPAGLAEQAFTLEALFRSRGVAVLADYDFRFAGLPGTRPGRRPGPEGRNSQAALTAAAGEPGGLEDLLRGTAAAMAVTARFTGSGPLGDGFHLRHFAHEGEVLTGPALLRAPEPVRRRVFAGVRRLVADHLGDAVLAGLRPGLRLRLSYVRAGDEAGLVSVLRYEAAHGVPPLRTDLVSADWRRTGAARHTLVVTARTPLPHLGALGVRPVRLTGSPEAGRILLRAASDGAGTEIEVRIPAEAFPPGLTRIGLSTVLPGTGHTAAVAPGTAARQAHGLRGLRPYRLDVCPDDADGLVVAVVPVGPRRAGRSRESPFRLVSRSPGPARYS